MKKLLLLISTSAYLLIGTSIFAQAPQAFKYQTIVRDNNGNILVSANVSFRISILQGTPTGTNVYSEKQIATTNQFGLANLNIGTGTLLSGSFNTITWGSGNYYVKIEFDATAGNNFVAMGTSQLLSVPYALYAQSGVAGVTGSTGAVGAQGAQGIVGATGTMGSTGSTGLIGGGSLAGNTSYWDGTQWVLNNANVFNNGANVGIGNSIPSEKLDVTGSIRFSGTLMPNNIAGMNGTVLSSLGSNTSPVWICSPGYFDCNNNAADGCEINLISDKNNCGFCGNACPTGQFCSNGVCTPSPGWNLAGNAGTIAGTNFIGTTDVADFSVNTNNTEKMRITTAGNVGIGTTTPTSTLSVGSSSQFQVNTTGNISKINNVTTSFPVSQGLANSVLQNDGAGNLSWASSIPVGTMLPFAGATVPAGYLLCDGSSVSRITYASLFTALGTAWGSASGTTFNLPDMRGRFMRGVDGAANNDPDKVARTASNTGGNTGNAVGSVQADDFKIHSHGIPVNTSMGAGTGSDTSTGALTSTNTTDTAGGSMETRPKNANVNFIIKY